MGRFSERSKRAERPRSSIRLIEQPAIMVTRARPWVRHRVSWTLSPSNLIGGLVSRCDDLDSTSQRNIRTATADLFAAGSLIRIRLMVLVAAGRQ